VERLVKLGADTLAVWRCLRLRGDPACGEGKPRALQCPQRPTSCARISRPACTGLASTHPACRVRSGGAGRLRAGHSNRAVGASRLDARCSLESRRGAHHKDGQVCKVSDPSRKAWAGRVGHAPCPSRRPALTRPSHHRVRPVTGLRERGHHTGGCVRQPAALWSVIMLGRGKARRWRTRKTSCTSSRRTLPGAAEFLEPGSAQSRFRLLGQHSSCALKDLTLLPSLTAWVPAPTRA
jgi:hypothetical protein